MIVGAALLACMVTLPGTSALAEGIGKPERYLLSA